MCRSGRWACGRTSPRTSTSTRSMGGSPTTRIPLAARRRSARCRRTRRTTWSATRGAWARCWRGSTAACARGTRASAPRALQLAELRAGLTHVLATNAFWRDRLHGVSGWDDFERLPLTSKPELLADQAAHPPFGTNLTFPVDRYTRLHQTSGSSGDQPLRWLDTADSWEWWTRIWAEHVYGAAGVTDADRVFFAFSFGPFIGFWSAFGGAERLGALCISGGAMTSEQRVRNMLDLGATVLLCTPTYALRVRFAVPEGGGRDPGARGRHVHGARGEPLPLAGGGHRAEVPGGDGVRDRAPPGAADGRGHAGARVVAGAVRDGAVGGGLAAGVGGEVGVPGGGFGDAPQDGVQGDTSPASEYVSGVTVKGGLTGASGGVWNCLQRH